MPISDFTNNTRTARLRQATLSIGVRKVGSPSSGSMNTARVLGGVPIKIKNSFGFSINNVRVDIDGNPLGGDKKGGGDPSIIPIIDPKE